MTRLERQKKIDSVFEILNEIREDFRIAWNETNISELQYLRAKTSFDIDCLEDLVNG